MAVLVPASAQAAKRIALLIGNAEYARQVGPLTNPINDVNLVAGALRKVGFEAGDIRIIKNGTRRQILQAVDAHVDALKAAGDDAIGFFYYSGHGAANKRDQRNYLIPVGVDRLDGSVWYDAIALDNVVSKLSDLAANAAHFVVFDACRNLLNMPTKGAKGFVPVSTRRGMLIAFSTDPGETASDEGQGSGPYAAALAAELVKPGLDHLDVFQNVKEAVYRKTQVQVPWERNGLLQRVYLAGRHTRTKRPASIDPAAQEWQQIRTSQDEAKLQDFANRHKGTMFAELALGRIALNRIHSHSMSAIREMGSKPVAPAGQCDGIDVKLATGKSVCLEPGSGKGFKDCDVCPEMVVIPAGSFMMGSNDGGSDEKPVRKVTISAPFAVGKYEVTFDEWDACVADGGCSHKPGDESWGRGKRPVINVSWDNITKQYLPWLSRKSGMAYRLLTEAEWEFVARAGTTSAYWWGDKIGKGNAVCDGCGSQWDNKQTAPVGTFKPNAFGLHDLHGNVWEWVQDCYKDSYRGAPTDGSAVTTGNCGRRVLRGGSWSLIPRYLRSASRGRVNPVGRLNRLGFRVVRMLTP